MDGEIGIGSLLAVAVVALAAPVLLGLLPRLRVPQVVLLIAGGVVIGPQVLGLGAPSGINLDGEVPGPELQPLDDDLVERRGQGVPRPVAGHAPAVAPHPVLGMR